MFGEWLPDHPDFMNPGSPVANNVIPIPGGYAPQRDMLDADQSVTGVCMGARLMFTSDGTDVIIGGGIDKLFKNVAGTSTSTSGFNELDASDAWDFCQFNDFVIATSINNAPKRLTDIDTDITWGGLAETATAPNARYCERVEDFLMLGNIEDHPHRIQWSPFNSPTGDWTPNRLTQAGYGDLPRHMGAVQRIVGGRYPLVMQERGINRLEYIGPPVVWRATEIEQQRGVLAPFSVVTVGFTTYYLGQDGFMSTDGNSFQPIGAGRVDRWFFETASTANLRETHGAIDFEHKCVVWAFKTGETFDRIIRYCWSENRWSTATVAVSRLVEAVTDGLTLEQIGALYATLEDIPVSLDDPRWQGRNRVLSAYIDGETSTHLNQAVGATLRANLETPEFQPVPGRRSMLKSCKVLGSGGENWVVASISIQNDRSTIQSTYRGPHAGGWSPLRGDGMSHRISCVASAGAVWDSVQGVQFDHRPSGKR